MGRFHTWQGPDDCSDGPTRGARAGLAWSLEEYPRGHSLGIYNCLAGDTKVLTRDGWQQIADLAGTEAELLTSDRRGPGRWVRAPVRSFGMQPLVRIGISRNGRHRTLYATAGHRWFVRSDYGGASLREVTTASLEPGDKLEATYPQSVATRTRPSPVGVQAGLVYGDGTRTDHDSQIALCGGKDRALVGWFSDRQPRSTYDDRLLVTALPRSFKDLPSLDEGTSYLYGWLAGFFAADGRVSEGGTPTLYQADADALEFVRLLAMRLGIVTGEVVGRKREGYGDEPTMLYEVTIDPRTLDSDFFLIPSHRERWNSSDRKRAPRWKVERVEATGRVEDVYCAVVPETECFVIDEFILTGNCRSVRGGNALSLHGEGRAWDFGLPMEDGTGSAYGHRYVDQLIDHAWELGLQAIIYDRTIWSARSPAGRPYTGAAPHHNHAHVELTRAASSSMTLADFRDVLSPTVTRAVAVAANVNPASADPHLDRMLARALGHAHRFAYVQWEDRWVQEYPDGHRLDVDDIGWLIAVGWEAGRLTDRAGAGVVFAGDDGRATARLVGRRCHDQAVDRTRPWQ